MLCDLLGLWLAAGLLATVFGAPWLVVTGGFVPAAGALVGTLQGTDFGVDNPENALIMECVIQKSGS